MPKTSKVSAADLDTTRIDDRWTLTKLYRAGYEEEWSCTCRTCGDHIACWRKLTLTGGQALILNEGVLTPHRCDGT